MESVPFTIPNVYQGFAETRGVARLEGDDLVLEFQTKDSVFGVLKSVIKRVKLPLSEIASIEFQKKYFSSWLSVRMRGVNIAQDVPNDGQGGISLQIARKHRQIAQRLAMDVELRDAEIHLEHIERREAARRVRESGQNPE
jgi:hypothetical protein